MNVLRFSVFFTNLFDWNIKVLLWETVVKKTTKAKSINKLKQNPGEFKSYAETLRFKSLSKFKIHGFYKQCFVHKES